MSQNESILSALKSGQELTPADALSLFGTMRLAARIDELRARGYSIQTTMRTVPGRHGPARVASYRLA